ncbi:MAG: hypothetical protein J5861_00470 [Desulfovibrio sp.]|nr:hypothetical protein [Desulfovibrio sp.]
MIRFDPLSGAAVCVMAEDGADSIVYAPTFMSDTTAAQEQMQSAESCQSFNETQFRMAAANMLGLGAVTSDWA